MREWAEWCFRNKTLIRHQRWTYYICSLIDSSVLDGHGEADSNQIIALVKCELQVVQSSRMSHLSIYLPIMAVLPPIGTDVIKSLTLSFYSCGVNSQQPPWVKFRHFNEASIYFLKANTVCQLVLVLGMCFFAGGTRFSEQGFGQSAYLLIPNQGWRSFGYPCAIDLHPDRTCYS